MNLALTVAAVLILLCAALVGGYLVLMPVQPPSPMTQVVPPPLPEEALVPEPLLEVVPPEPVVDKAPETAPDLKKAPEEPKLAPPPPPAPPADTSAATKTMREELESRSFSMQVKNMKLESALELLAALLDIEIDTSQLAADDLDQMISMNFDDTPATDALEFICTLKGLSYEVTPRGVVIN